MFVCATCIEWKVLFVVCLSFLHFGKAEWELKASLRKLNDDTSTTYTIHSAIKWSIREEKERAIKMNSHWISHYVRRHGSALHAHTKGIGNTMECIVVMHKIYTLFYVWICSINSFRIVDLVLFCMHPLWVLIWCAMFATIRLKASRSSDRAHSVRSSITQHHKRMRKNTFSRIS